MFLFDIALILTLILSVLYPIILIFGIIISWRKSFKEGVICFILIKLFIKGSFCSIRPYNDLPRSGARIEQKWTVQQSIFVGLKSLKQQNSLIRKGYFDNQIE
ncbi:hypothetical protein BKP45_14925 [Anaerobacillus alkalidiazotrophicus]|uniref:Uncharacterized protein n=1 Tax=Anaerobacillus alkalidiazotrophicus TaxID=472963 RepID=A0A1S2M2T7_9BACI|nr:hypothetical protein [Anaerobacillus alkalidiazotrophicus]OIJ19011.1 hypothetical protein BKP45_14925 [Anaerobacillus alkalidiazotrophicus]